jgi:hypothetical protein
MKLILRISAAVAIGLASVGVLINLGGLAGLWWLNAPTQNLLTQTLTFGDHLLQNADAVMANADSILHAVVQIGQDLDAEVATLRQQEGEQRLEDVQAFTSNFSQSTVAVQGQLEAMRSNVQATEQAIATSIRRVPRYVNLTWIAMTLVILWLTLGQVAIFYLARRYLRTGRLG